MVACESVWDQFGVANPFVSKKTSLIKVIRILIVSKMSVTIIDLFSLYVLFS